MKSNKSQTYYINTKIIFDYMKTHGLNKTQFAKLCGFSLTTLNRVLGGNANLSFWTLYGLLKTLKCKSVELIGV